MARFKTAAAVAAPVAALLILTSLNSGIADDSVSPAAAALPAEVRPDADAAARARARPERDPSQAAPPAISLPQPSMMPYGWQPNASEDGAEGSETPDASGAG